MARGASGRLLTLAAARGRIATQGSRALRQRDERRGAGGRNRTDDLLITSQLLCHLSYASGCRLTITHACGWRFRAAGGRGDRSVADALQIQFHAGGFAPFDAQDGLGGPVAVPLDADVPHAGLDALEDIGRAAHAATVHINIGA